MATKFYFLDAVSPNTGTMPTGSPAVIGGGVLGAGTEAAGAATARDTDQAPGASNPDVESQITSEATTNLQRLGHRRFVSRPLAAVTVTANLFSGNWSCSESSLLHNQSITMIIYAWRPGTGARVGAGHSDLFTAEPTVAATEQNFNSGQLATADMTILDGDILVFDVYSEFSQGMASVYTDEFAYDGTTETSTTTCASYVSTTQTLSFFGGSVGAAVVTANVAKQMRPAASYR
jgi:hypothetical protein